MPSTVLTVTPERKHELLMEARHSRLSWVQSASIPYKQNQESSLALRPGDDGVGVHPSSRESEKSSPSAPNKPSKEKEDPLSILNSSPLCQEMPSTIPVLRSLLTTTTDSITNKTSSIGEAATIAQNVLDTSVSAAYVQTLEKWKEKIQANAASMHRDQLVGALDDHAFLFYYKEVIDRLCMPESMDVVQGMRCFVRTFVALGNTLTSSSSSNTRTTRDKDRDTDGNEMKGGSNTSDGDNDRNFGSDVMDDNTSNQNLDRLVQSIQKYISSLHESLANHDSWREGTELSSETKMMLDTFIYSKCHQTIMIEGLLVDDQLVRGEAELGERLDFLDHFVNPAHLEIGCFMDDDTGEGDQKWKSGLKLPVTLLQSLDKMYSPAQMLRCILEVYRGVNNTLKTAIIERSSHGDGRGPSADDVLPTLILSIINAKPRKLLTVLRFLENFATEEQLRGEAGYAYTNLFGATQFIRELDLDVTEEGEEDKEDDGRRGARPSLSIAPEVLKEKLSEFREKLEAVKSTGDVVENADNDDHVKVNDESSTGDSTDYTVADDRTDKQSNILRRIRIPVNEVTAARLRGEDLTEWAKEWSVSQQLQYSSNLSTASGESTGQTDAEDESVLANTTLPLPEGFTRSYKFLATEADDIRMSDIPSLLEEYRMLVRTTEILIMERNAVATKQHKLEMKNKKEHLDHSLAEVSSAIGKD